ncbi:MAG: hypothetical protein WDA60_08900 [Acidimicrobiia bacterium]|jgi:hypothetical protein
MASLDRRPARLRNRPALAALTAGLALVETAILSLLGPVTGLALAPQVSAPTPFDQFHDLRWIAVYTPSWWVVVLAVAGWVAARSAVTATIVGLAWPADVPLPDARERMRRAWWATVIVGLLLVPWVVLAFATAVFSLSWTWIVAVPVVVMVSAIVHCAAVSPRRWRTRPPARGVVAVLVAFASTTVLGAIVAAGPAWARWPAVLAAGVVNAWCWLRVTDAAARTHVEARGRPFAVVALAGVLALVVAGAAVGFAVAVALERDRAPAPRAAPIGAGGGPPVLVVKGFDSRWDGVTRRWVDGDVRIRRYSYAGLGRDGEPRPYGRAATHASVRTLARRLGTQVDALAAATGEPVGIVAESEGALVALTYALGTPGAPVRSVVALSPLVEPGRVSYPAPGRVGWGVAAGAALDGVAAIVDRLGPVDVRSDTPLFRSIVEQAPLFQGLLRCGAPGVRELAVLPFDTGLAAPRPASVTIPYVVRPAFHGGLLGDDRTAELVARVLHGRAVDTQTRWRATERVVQALASPWQVPSLAKSLEPAWRDLPDPDDCPAVRRGLRAYLTG